MKMASGTPFLLFATWVNAATAFAWLAGKVPADQFVVFISISLVAGFSVFFGGLIELIRGDLLTGTMNMMFGLFFMFLGGLNNLWIFQGMIAGVPVAMGIGSAYLFASLFFVLLVLTPCYFYLSWLFVILILCADIGVGIIALVSFGLMAPAYYVLAAWLILGFGVICLYVGMAIIINDLLGKYIFPLGTPLLKKPAA